MCVDIFVRLWHFSTRVLTYTYGIVNEARLCTKTVVEFSRGDAGVLTDDLLLSLNATHCQHKDTSVEFKWEMRIEAKRGYLLTSVSVSTHFTIDG